MPVNERVWLLPRFGGGDDGSGKLKAGIENYLGFPTGISGQELAARALTQAEKFGAERVLRRARSC